MSDHNKQLVPLQGLPAFSDLAALPLGVRVLDLLTEVLILSDELLLQLQTEDGYQLLWLEPHIQRVYDDVDQAMRRLSQ
jgi:hypothetical protein